MRGWVGWAKRVFFLFFISGGEKFCGKPRKSAFGGNGVNESRRMARRAKSGGGCGDRIP